MAVALTSLSHGAGCGCKLPAAAVAPLLAGLPARSTTPTCSSASTRPTTPGVYRLRDDLALVQTVDFFTPIVDDPFDFGRIAAANALSDVYAMGADPICALNLVAFSLERLGGSRAARDPARRRHDRGRGRASRSSAGTRSRTRSPSIGSRSPGWSIPSG